MQFIRAYSNNIINDDTYSHRREYYDTLNPEIFDISDIIIYTPSNVYNFNEKEVEKVIESFNYFTIIYKQTNPAYDFKKIVMIKYNQVEKVEFGDIFK